MIYSNGAKKYRYTPEVIYSAHGHPIQVCRFMPRIDDQILDSVIYLYPSVEDARESAEVGGAGFLIALPSQEDRYHSYIYAVTNAHVITEVCAPVIRLNTTYGAADTIPLAINNWVTHPDGDDLAVAPLFGLNPRVFNFSCTPSSLLLTREKAEALDLGPGDDVYMVGRFVYHEGKRRNKPATRSGIIGLMPDPREGIEFYKGGFKQEAFLVEMRSISGFSGSPVLFRLPLYADEAYLKIERPKMTPQGMELPFGPWLLGIDCGKFFNYDKVYELRQSGTEEKLDETDLRVKGHTGYSIVIPAWKLIDFLDMEVLAVPRQEEEKKIAERRQKSNVELDAKKKLHETYSITPVDFEEEKKET